MFSYCLERKASHLNKKVIKASMQIIFLTLSTHMHTQTKDESKRGVYVAFNGLYCQFNEAYKWSLEMHTG